MAPAFMTNTQLPSIDEDKLDNVTGDGLFQDLRDIYTTWHDWRDGWGPIPPADPPRDTQRR